MKLPASLRTLHALRLAKVLTLTAMLSAGSVPSHAVQTSATFGVALNLIQPGNAAATPTTGTCGTSGTRSSVLATVICSNGAYRFVTNLRTDNLATSVDGYAGVISTSSRLVSLPTRQYIEMTVGW